MPTIKSLWMFGILLTGLASHGAANLQGAEDAQTIESHPSWSGIYPHLAFFNDENECGTGAVVPWAGSLWAVTYAPHQPKGSTDKLYQITPSLELIVRPESIGGTPANRMIHRESGQLFIGPYAISESGSVRTIPYDRMYGRPTGTARHLIDPENSVYFATMEEGFYSVNVHTLEVTEHFRDEQLKDGLKANLPGYHGKGLFTGQGRLIYSNNGEHGQLARQRPDIPSGCLAEWDGQSESWKIVRRNQFTEVTGPGGIYGNADPENDPVWAMGWDHRSLILMVLDDGEWHSYRLPKSSHSYDGAHGWNTEWPRIRDVGMDHLLMTMHGSFWAFPKGLTSKQSGGIRPLSNYLKVIGDFCEWNGSLVFGCDDTARMEFLNKRKAKGEIAAPQSQSNLWFVKKDRLESFGPVIGRGAVWLKDHIAAGETSEPFLISGYDRRAVHLHHTTNARVSITMEVDVHGNGSFVPFKTVILAPNAYLWEKIDFQGQWLRLKANTDITAATAQFHFSNRDTRPTTAPPAFDGIAESGDTSITGGIIRARGGNERSLHFASIRPGTNGPEDVGYYEMGGDMKLVKVDNDQSREWLKENAKIPAGVLEEDEASVVFIDDSGHRFRLPHSTDSLISSQPVGPQRIDREVSTERDLFNSQGTFFELPAENAGGFLKVRPVSTHNRRISDYCSYRGLLVISGINTSTTSRNHHIIQSDDKKTALWVGAVDDLWSFGKPVGQGGPWMDTNVSSGIPSDPYLMTGYDRKALSLRADRECLVTAEIDLDGTGFWVDYKSFTLRKDQTLGYEFPKEFQAYWIRFRSDTDATISAQLTYR